MKTKPAYQLNANGFYIGETVADASPLEVDVWLVPSGAVMIAPPLTWPDNKWPRFNGKKWVLDTFRIEPVAESPVAHLMKFLADNPELAALLKQGGV